VNGQINIQIITQNYQIEQVLRIILTRYWFSFDSIQCNGIV